MDNIYLIVFLLVVLGVIDLVVGVSNDAVNFLNSAIGSKVSKRKYIYMVASAGIILGVMFSGGMMEVARKGVFNPQFFYLNELLIIFLAAMITDVILIDIFNTFGYPTSTTISIVFELLGGALALGLIIIGGENPDQLNIGQLINTESALVILIGIVISIILAFLTGTFFQFLARLVFTFRYKNKFKTLFSVAGAASLTALIFLILKKEIFFANLLYGSAESLVENNLMMLLGIVFSASFILFLVLSFWLNVDIPKVVVFFGTFTLALSFASNDLVNLIGIPLSGIEGAKSFMDSGNNNASLFLMNIWEDGLLNNILGENFYKLAFLISGLIMVITLFTSRKLRTVTDTEVYLGRQGTGYESFEASQFSRMLVWRFLQIFNKVRGTLPAKMVSGIANRYERTKAIKETSDQVVYFDTVRASVNLVVASILVAIGTYFSTPLSTTFVVFMVAMGTSLADQAWGRESAVYRISGVLSVLGGWFITAAIAFIGAFVIAIFIWWGKIYAIVVLTLAVVFSLYRTTIYHRKQYKQKKDLISRSNQKTIETIGSMVDLGKNRIRKHIIETSKIYMLIIQGFVDENLKQLKDTREKAELLKKEAKSTKNELFNSFTQIESGSFDAGHYFIQALDYLGETTNALLQITEPICEHVENQHKGLSDSQKEDALLLLEEVAGFFNYLIHIEKDSKFDSVPDIVEKQKYILDLIEDLRKIQLKRLMDKSKNSRSSILLLECYAESKNLILYTINLLKSHRDFYLNSH